MIDLVDTGDEVVCSLGPALDRRIAGLSFNGVRLLDGLLVQCLLVGDDGLLVQD